MQHFYIFLFFFFSGCISGIAQSDFHPYVAPTFSPPVQAMIDQFEGSPAMAIEANDIHGQQHKLGGKQSKKTVLWFWNKNEDKCLSLIPLMNEVARLDVHFVCLADEPKAEMIRLSSELTMKFPVIGNSFMLSQAVYGSELGYPRAFILDTDGLIVKVFPESELTTDGSMISKIKFFLQ